jgi:putative DNA primase/helicase
VQWVKENRGKILHAILTLGRGWVVAGMPESKAKVPVIGGFDSWTHTIGGILDYAGIEGFLGNLEEMYQIADEESEEWEAFLRRWREVYGEIPQLVSTVVKHIKDEIGLTDTLPDDIAAIAELTANGRRISFERRLGKALASKRGVRYGDDGIHLAVIGEGKKAKLWCVKLSIPSQNQIVTGTEGGTGV